MDNWEGYSIISSMDTRDLLLHLPLPPLLLWLTKLCMRDSELLYWYKIWGIMFLTLMLLGCIMWLSYWLFDKFCQEPIMRGKFGYLPVIWAVWLLGFIKTNERKALCNAIFYVDQLPAPPASAPPA